MSFKQGFFSAALLTMALFAGCIQAESTPPAGADDKDVPVAAGPAEFDETTGAISGSVTTSDLSPVAGAQVGILPSDIIIEPFVVLTDVAGQFTFSHVPPGTHTLQTSALGFDAVSKRTTVEAGAVASVQFILTELPSEEPYMNTIMEPVQFTSIMYKATPMCIYEPLTTVNPSVKTCGGVRLGGTPLTTNCTACESHTAINEKYASFNEHWETIIGEVTWQPQSGVTGRGFLFDINAPNVTRGTSGSISQGSPYTWYKGTDEAPIQIAINKAELAERGIPESDWNNYPDGEGCTAPGESCDWMWRMFGARCDLGFCDEGLGPDWGILIEGKAEVYFSYFIRQPAPEGFSALPDA